MATAHVSTKRNLVIDLDETLISTIVMHKTNYENIKKYSCYPNMLIQFENASYKNIVFFRPYALDFIRKMAAHFNLYIYTHGTEIYCKMIVNALTALMDFYPFVNICWRGDDITSKHLNKLGLSPHDTIIIDDNIGVWKSCTHNVVVVRKFHNPRINADYLSDGELPKLIRLLHDINSFCSDATSTLSKIIQSKNTDYQTGLYENEV